MATWYIRTTGSDSNAGTSAGAAFLTLNKAIGASGSAASGDQIYMGAGVYRLTAAQAVTLAPTAETKITGDPTGQFTGDAGEVVITGYGTNDSTAPFAGNLFSFAAARNFYTWENITFRAPQGSIFPWAANNCHDWTFTDCTFYARIAGGSSIFTLTTQAGTASNILFNRCRIKQMSTSAVFAITATLHSADYDLNIVMKSCYVRNNATCLQMNATASAGAGIPYGLQILECTFDGTAAALLVTSAAHSIAGGASKSVVKRCIFDIGANTPINAGNTNQVTADWNRLLGGTAYTNTTAGGNDLATNAKSYFPDLGQDARFGAIVRPWMTPGNGDPHNIFVTDSTGYTVDLLNRPSPAGGASSNTPVGALARHDTAISPGTTVGADSGTGYIEIVGAGDDQFDVPVDSVAQTISIKVKTSGYSGTNYPEMKILFGGEIGVADQTITATSASASAYETLTSASFSPTAKGIITIRLTNRSANGTGIAAFDSFQVT